MRFANDEMQNNLEEIISTYNNNDEDKEVSAKDRWGKNDRYASEEANTYFSQTIEESFAYPFLVNTDERGDYSLSVPPFLPYPVENGKVIIGYESVQYGSFLGLPVYKYYLKFDYKIPDNDTSCGIVATAMIMQYYDRKNYSTIPSAFIKAKEGLIIYNLNKISTLTTDKPIKYNPNKPEYLAYHLHGTLDSITAQGSSTGANNTLNLKEGLEDFYEKYQPVKGERKLILDSNAAYKNIVGCIDSGNLAIGMTHLIGNGYYKDANDVWYQTGVERHHMVIYGYCTSDSGELKDFICHGGWKSANTSKLYVYKTNFISNATTYVMEV